MTQKSPRCRRRFDNRQAGKVKDDREYTPNQFAWLVGRGMSIEFVRAVLEHSQSTGADRLVLLVLAERANAEGACWPSIADISARAKVSDRAARRAIAALVNAGELWADRRGGKGKASVYRIRLGKADSGGHVSSVETPPKADAGGHVSDTKGGRSRSQRRSNLTAKADTGGHPTVRNRKEPASVLSAPEVAELARNAGVEPEYVERLVRNVEHLRATGKLRKGWRQYVESGVRSALDGKPYGLLNELEAQDAEAAKQAGDAESRRERSMQRRGVAAEWWATLADPDRDRLLAEAKQRSAARREPIPNGGDAAAHVVRNLLANEIGTAADRESFVPFYDAWRQTSATK